MKKLILCSFVSLLAFSSESFGMQEDLVEDRDNLSESPKKRHKPNSDSHQQIQKHEVVGITPQKVFDHFFEEEAPENTYNIFDGPTITDIEESPKHCIQQDGFSSSAFTHYFEPKYLNSSTMQNEHLGDVLDEKKKNKKKPTLIRTQERKYNESITDQSSKKEKKPFKKNLKDNQHKKKPYNHKIDSEHPQLRDKRNIYAQAYIVEENNDQITMEVSQIILPTTFQIFSMQEIQELDVNDFFCEKEPESHRKEEASVTASLSILTKLSQNCHNKIVLESNETSKRSRNDNSKRSDGDVQMNSIGTTNKNAKENFVFKVPTSPHRTMLSKKSLSQDQVSTK